MMSKYQKRKLKKLAEEKEKDKLLSKSLEILEKYKVSEDVHTLLLSSQKIGQDETMLEKRRRNMQFCKAGLEVPESGLRPKRRKVDVCEREVEGQESCLLEVADENSTLCLVPIARACRKHDSVLPVPSQGPVQRCCGDDGGSDAEKLIKEVANTCKSIQSDTGKSSFCHSHDNDRKDISTTVSIPARCKDTHE